MEIGGFFEIEIENGKKGFYSDLIAVNTGRNAIRYVVEASKYKVVYLPYYCCGCIADTLLNMGVECKYYHIDKELKPMNVYLAKDEAILVINYYGQLRDEEILGFKEKYKNIILDNTQSFFSRPIDGVDTVYSARKYFGVSDGAYVQSENKLDRPLERDFSVDRVIPMIGRFETFAKSYYMLQKQKEESLDGLDLLLMSKFTSAILGNIDYEKVKQIRETNFKFFHAKLEKINELNIVNDKATFMYPLKIKNAAKIREWLIANDIFIPVLWPELNQEELASEFELSLREDVLNLPIDQRYDTEQLQLVVERILLNIENPRL